MGGNALKTVVTQRLTDRNYHRLAVDVAGKLQPLFDKVAVIPAYTGKADFGDMGVVVQGDRDEPALHAAFGYHELVKNGDVWSFDYEKFQIDVIRVTPDVFDYALSYFSFNDLGNLIGRVAHSLGFKHGHNGLQYVVRDGDRVVDEIVLTTDHDTALRFLGFDADAFRNGFASMQEIFEYVATSAYFNPDIYLLHNRNAIARTRDSKRKTYNQFLEWCAITAPAVKFVANRGDKSDYLLWAFASFPGFQQKYEAAWDAHERKKAIAVKFNGTIVGEATGLVGKDLGAKMFALRQKANYDWLLTSSESDIVEWILTE